MSPVRTKRTHSTTPISSGHDLRKISGNIPLRALVAKCAPTYFSVDVAPPTRSSALRSELGRVDFIGDSVFAIGTRAPIDVTHQLLAQAVYRAMWRARGNS